jgi:hypothetical protein
MGNYLIIYSRTSKSSSSWSDKFCNSYFLYVLRSDKKSVFSKPLHDISSYFKIPNIAKQKINDTIHTQTECVSRPLPGIHVAALRSAAYLDNAAPNDARCPPPADMGLMERFWLALRLWLRFMEEECMNLGCGLLTLMLWLWL